MRVLEGLPGCAPSSSVGVVSGVGSDGGVGSVVGVGDAVAVGEGVAVAVSVGTMLGVGVAVAVTVGGTERSQPARTRATPRCSRYSTTTVCCPAVSVRQACSA
jgi:hypothetical protein